MVWLGRTSNMPSRLRRSTLPVWAHGWETIALPGPDNRRASPFCGTPLRLPEFAGSIIFGDDGAAPDAV
jgi:hypothetical protein